MKILLKPTLNRDAFNVLLVEDNQAEAELIQKLLLEVHGEQFFFTHVKSLTEAIAAFNQDDFDVIIVSLSLPDINGLNTLTRVQEYVDQHNKSVCPAIVVLVGSDNEELTLQSIRAGAQECLVKGHLESDRLIRSLRYAIARRDAIASIVRQQTRDAVLRREPKCGCIISDATSIRGRAGEGDSGGIPQHSSQDKEAIFTPLPHHPIVPSPPHSLNRFFTLSLDLLCIAGVDGYFKCLNPAWETTLGYSISELLERPFIEFVHPEDREATRYEAQKLHNSGTPTLKFENRYICKDGSYRWFSWTAVPFSDEDLTYAVARDITEQKLAQEALRQSERRLRGYFENSLVGIVIITPDKNWIEVNDALCNLLGYSREELTKKNWMEWTHPDDLTTELDQLLLIFAGETDGYVLDKRFIRKDGQVVYTRLSVRCIRREDEGCDHLIAVIIDISDRCRYEQHLKQAEGFLKHTLNAIADPIFVKDEHQSWILVNDAFCQLIGKSREQLMGKSDYDFLSKAEAERFWKTDELVLTTGRENEHEENLTDNQGNLHILSTKRSIFENADRSHILVGTIRDVTNYKRVLEALQQSEARLQKLAANVPGMIYEFVQHTDRSFSFPYASSACREICEVEPEQLMENAGLLLERIHHNDRNGLYRAITTSAQTLQPFTWEGRIVGCTSGKLKWLQTTARPEKLANGDTLWHGVAVDISDRLLAEEALRISQERLQLALEGSDLGLWDWNMSSGQTYFDPQWKRMLGYDVDESDRNYLSWEQLLHPEDRPRVMEVLNAYLEGHTPIFRVEFRMRSKSGEWQWILGRGKVFEWDESGQPVRMTGTHKDITERKTLQRELALREARLNAFFNSSPVGLKIMDDQLRFVQINEPLAQINGLPASDHIGKTMREVVPNLAPLLEHIHLEVLRTGKAILNVEVSGEVPSLPGVVRHWMTSYFPIPGEENRPCGVGSVVVEITERKQAEAELHRTQQFLNSLLENLPVGVFAKDARELRFVYWNKACTELMGFEVSEVIGKSDYDLFPQEQANYCTAQDREALLSGRLVANPAEVVHTHRGQRIFSVNKIAIFDEEGRPEYVLGIVDDITERQQAEERLRLLERAIAASSNGIVITDATLPDHPLVYINEGFERITGYSAEEVMGQNCRFLQGTDREQPALDELRTALQEERECRVRLRNYRKDGTLFWNEFSISPVRNAAGTLTHHIGVHSDITELKQAEAALQKQVERERLVGLMRGRIRRTLNLQAVLTTAVEEVRQFLHTDRTVIYRFHPDWSGTIAVESVGEGWTPLLGLNLEGNCFPQTSVLLYQQGRIAAIEDIYNAGLHQCYIDLLERLEVKANLVVPLLQGETLWGLLIGHHCSSSRHWDVGEIECLRQLGVQLAIAIQQSTLFEQAQREIAERKRAQESLRRSESRERKRAKQLSNALHNLKNAQAQLIQTEKMASLGQLVAGVAHEINNPTCFIYGNVAPAMGYANDLLNLIAVYQKHYPAPCEEIQSEIEAIELDFIKEDFPKLLRSMQEGASRIQHIVLTLRNFSRLDEADRKKADLHNGIDSTLMILQNRLKEQPTRPAIQMIKQFGDLPLVDCYPSELNQAFINILSNAIDAIENKIKEDSSLIPQIQICTEVVRVNEQATESPIPNRQSPIPVTDKVIIRITDNGTGISSHVLPRVFDPFFTTKPVGKGTGLGLSIAHSIVVKKHKGKLYCHSQYGQGTEFAIELPILNSKFKMKKRMLNDNTERTTPQT